MTDPTDPRVRAMTKAGEWPGLLIEEAISLLAAADVVDPVRSEVIELRQQLADAQAEVAVYKRAKAENDERFMLERDEARGQLDKIRALHHDDGYGRCICRAWPCLVANVLGEGSGKTPAKPGVGGDPEPTNKETTK